MVISKINLKNPQETLIKKAASIIDEGGLVICPTDTTYLLAADATNPKAIEKVYKLKGREKKKPIHVVVPNTETAKKYVFFNQNALDLAKKFWPGQLTLVLKKRESILAPNLSKNQSIGIRVPDLALNLSLARELGRPYTATSANKSGGPNPYSFDDVVSQFNDAELSLINLFLDGGSLAKKPPSTVVDSQTRKAKIIRRGAVKI